jgi:predicted nucleotidyltransferase
MTKGPRLNWIISARDVLQRRVTAALEADSRIERAELAGSLASGTADIYSDIDLRAYLKPGFVDREFFLEVPSLMDKVGPRVTEGWSFSALPRLYVVASYFEDLPLFWHVDIDCRPASEEWHVDAADLQNVPRWEQRYKVWVESMLRLARVESGAEVPARKAFDAHFEDMKMRMSKRVDLSGVSGEPRQQLAALLDLETAWHKAHRFDVERLDQACRQLWQDVFGNQQRIGNG